jgi:hypothetical protein
MRDRELDLAVPSCAVQSRVAKSTVVGAAPHAAAHHGLHWQDAITQRA